MQNILTAIGAAMRTDSMRQLRLAAFGASTGVDARRFAILSTPRISSSLRLFVFWNGHGGPFVILPTQICQGVYHSLEVAICFSQLLASGSHPFVVSQFVDPPRSKQRKKTLFAEVSTNRSPQQGPDPLPANSLRKADRHLNFKNASA